jgi:hypothetical protein
MILEYSEQQIVGLVHNGSVSYFEQCLTFGDRLLQEERRALYKYLLESNKDFYKVQAKTLLAEGKVSRTIANGQAIYSVKNSQVTYSAYGLQSEIFSIDVRQIRLSKFRLLNEIRLRKFFAQGDIDIIRNFPLPSRYLREENGFGISVYPFYTLAYYANGKNYLKGIIKKLKTNDKEILTKLRTL